MQMQGKYQMRHIAQLLFPEKQHQQQGKDRDQQNTCRPVWYRNSYNKYIGEFFFRRTRFNRLYSIWRMIRSLCFCSLEKISLFFIVKINLGLSAFCILNVSKTVIQQDWTFRHPSKTVIRKDSYFQRPSKTIIHEDQSFPHLSKTVIRKD